MNFYFDAANVLDRIVAKKGSIKGILAEVNQKDRKRMSAAVIRTLEYKPVLIEIIQKASLLREERKLITSTNLALLLVHDLLFSKGIQAGDGPIKRAILRHKTRLHSELVKIKIKRGIKDNAQLGVSTDTRTANIPRYVRVNRNAGSLHEILIHLKRTFPKVPDCEVLPHKLDPETVYWDPHISDLLAFNPSVSFQNDPAYLDGRLILQDKASCLPAFLLAPPIDKEIHAIDATAAPGNKTSHLSVMMGNKGKIYAFERDSRRFKTLEQMLAKARCENVEATCADFLCANPLDVKYGKVSHILIDPSCSGSGIVNRMDYLMENDSDSGGAQSDRLLKLAEFQLRMIDHAMKFPNAQKIVYSTCSVHPQENEHVVRQALKSEVAIRRHFRLAPRSLVLPSWARRGLHGEMNCPGE
ncbi:S-adenosyl-L-methionine-dependent methyltransferase [Cantharellus anzutake]|uniref:S-adenosyl-L-methionine-dependent methyltransferase n=1 Tax=Cantharellus anzutake TaxID=1750568 RepID=UPI001904DBB2|nr:S-adenosyl-L-methionine-dependent methyltransferase [Cantharellus anzutake]KAF8339690.1 S-adenosyl-L-methionine-dependent methyltransferase [Cantharellus anzutake]